VESHTGRVAHQLRLGRIELVDLAVRIEHLRAVAKLTEQDAAGIQQLLARRACEERPRRTVPRMFEALF